MKRRFLCLIALWMVLAVSGAAAETPLGFGYVNTDRTNLREGVGGPVVTRKGDGDAVYILEQRADGGGRLWYRVNTEHNDRPVTAWVQARYITAGSALFHDVVQVAAGEKGMLALQGGGTVVGVADENAGSRMFQKTIAQWKNVKQVACGFMTYLALLEGGSLRGFGNMAYEDWNSVRGVRLLNAKDSCIVFVTEDGSCSQESYGSCYVLGEKPDWRRAEQITACDYGVIALYPSGQITCVFYENKPLPTAYHSITGWNDLTAIDSGDRSFTMLGTDDIFLRPLLAFLHRDGTVSALPADQIPAVGAWTDITDVKAGWDFILGLRADGTVAAAGGYAPVVEQVAEWTNIKAIDACLHYCAGVKEDGTLVFAGEYTFH